MGLVPSQAILSTDEMGRIAPPIFTSVGRGGVNQPGDVFVIQSLLNDRLPKPHAVVATTGTVDVGTVLAIESYQVSVMHVNSAVRPRGSGEQDVLFPCIAPTRRGRAAVCQRALRPGSATGDRRRRRFPASLAGTRVCYYRAMGRREFLGRRDTSWQQQSLRHQGGARRSIGGVPDARGDERRKRYGGGAVSALRIDGGGVRPARTAAGDSAPVCAGDAS